MVKVCSNPECHATCMGGRLCKICGAMLTDVGDRSRREDVRGVGIAIRALYAARAAMVLSCGGFLAGAMIGLMFVREAVGATSIPARGGWIGVALLAFAAIWWGATRLGKLHYDRVLAANLAATGMTGAEHDFFPDGEGDFST